MVTTNLGPSYAELYGPITSASDGTNSDSDCNLEAILIVGLIVAGGIAIYLVAQNHDLGIKIKYYEHKAVQPTLTL